MKGLPFDDLGVYGTLLYIAVHSQYRAPYKRSNMATAKTTTLTFRIAPSLKEALRAAAEQEHRSIANMVEVMILEYCGRNGVSIPRAGFVLKKKGAQ